MTSPQVRRALTSGAILLLPLAAAAQTPAPTDLGTLGGNSAWGQAINARGAVAGTSETADGSFRAFLAIEPGGVLRGVGPADTPGLGLGINDLGDVSGSSDRAFVFIRGRLRMLASGVANDINNLREAAGWRHVAPDETHAVVWPASGRARDLGTPGEQSFASALNDRGDVAGWVTGADGLAQAVLWAASGGRIALGTLGGRYSQALAINESGDVVGVSEAADGMGHAFLWRRGSPMIDLGEPGRFSSAFGVNDAGQVVGEHVDADGRQRAFVWSESTGLVSLDTPMMPEGSSRATAINDLGEIAGLVADATEARAVVWVVPPDASAQIAGLERLIRQVVRDRLLSSSRVSACLAQVRAASRSLRSRRADRASAHLRSAARLLGRLSAGRSQGRILHLQLVAQRAASVVDNN